jgi:hypothetical protein
VPAFLWAGGEGGGEGWLFLPENLNLFGPASAGLELSFGICHLKFLITKAI